MLGTPDLDDVGRQADEIIQRAREEAERIVADGRARAASLGAAAGVAAAAGGTEEERAAINAFLAREKEFLQSLAGLVQGHAGSVKEMAKAARTRGVAPAPPSAPTPTSAPAARARRRPDGRADRGPDASRPGPAFDRAHARAGDDHLAAPGRGARADGGARRRRRSTRRR